jgi:hypothetical protein
MPIIYDENGEESGFALLITKYTELFANLRKLHEEQQRLSDEFKTDIDRAIAELRGDLQQSYARLNVDTADVRKLNSQMMMLISEYSKKIDRITTDRISLEIDKSKDSLKTTAENIAEDLFTKHINGEFAIQIHQRFHKSIHPWKVIIVLLSIVAPINLITLVLFAMRIL